MYRKQIYKKENERKENMFNIHFHSVINHALYANFIWWQINDLKQY